MSADGQSRHARVKQLFNDAVARTRAERDAFLQQACADDDELRREVEELLAFDDRSPEFLETTAVAGLDVSEPWSHPTQLGPFRILRLLGEGGMGAVYEAEQERPRRSVALKVLHPGLGTPQMLRRFELESEVLGRLQHAGIARIYEAGTSDTGRGPQPWFAMELIDGEPLTQHCVRRALPLVARIELLARVADAVQHAHQRGIVHRDLKPANVLVDVAGQPKVLDFGIARAIDDDLQQATLRTDPGMVVGTLQYMSPEQASADPDAIDVRTDVYSLGVMLYELAAGQPPLELRRLPVHEALRRVLEVEPAPLRSVARVPVDVALIAHMALAKDKERRYASAAGLAADLRRFLRREPIAAQAPSSWYRLRRFTARNKPLVGGVAATFVALVIGLALAIWQRNEARQALARAEGIKRFLVSDLIASPSPERLGREVRVADVLAPALRSAERTFAGDPRLAAEVLDAVGASYRSLGMVTESEAATRRALDLIGADATDRLALRIRGNMVAVLTDLDLPAQAVPAAEAAVAASLRELGADDPDTLARRVELANARWNSGDRPRALGEFRAVVGDQARVLGESDARTLATRSQLAINLADNGAIAEARELLTTTVASQERVLGPVHPGTLNSRNHLGWILTLGSEWEQAEKLYRELLPLLEEVYGADNPYTALARVEMAQCPMRLGRPAEAEKMIRAAIAVFEPRVGVKHAWTLKAQRVLAHALFRQGQFADAIAVADGVVGKLRSGPPTEDLGHALNTLGRCQQTAGDANAAAATFREAADVYRAVFDAPTDYLAQSLYNCGVATRDAGQPLAAIAPLQEAMAIDIQTWGADHRHVISNRYNLARTLLAAERAEDAVVQMRAAVQSAESQGLEPRDMLRYRGMLGQALVAAGEVEAGERQLVEVVDGFAALGSVDAESARARRALVMLYERQGRATDAARYRDQGR